MTPEALATLLRDPSRAEALPPGQVPEVLGQVERLRAALWSRLITSPAATDAPAPSSDLEKARGDRLLTVQELGERLTVDDRYVYRHADKWPFTRRLSPGTLRFSEQGFTRWLARR